MGEPWEIGNLHPGRLTWNLQITHLERKMIFQTSMIMFHVNLPGCTPMKFNSEFSPEKWMAKEDDPASYWVKRSLFRG